MQPDLFAAPSNKQDTTSSQGTLIPENLEAIQLIDDDGNLRAWPNLLTETAADLLFNEILQQTDWQQESIKLYGQWYKQPRLTAWYGITGVSASSAYTQTTHSQEFSPALLTLKDKIEAITGHSYNSVLANLYRDGQDSVAFHADDEAILGKHPAIASFSLGASRQFSIKKNLAPNIHHSFELKHNSLVLMSGSFQEHWQHSISKTTKPVQARINLTFRQLHLALP